MSEHEPLTQMQCHAGHDPPCTNDHFLEEDVDSAVKGILADEDFTCSECEYEDHDGIRDIFGCRDLRIHQKEKVAKWFPVIIKEKD